MAHMCSTKTADVLTVWPDYKHLKQDLTVWSLLGAWVYTDIMVCRVGTPKPLSCVWNARNKTALANILMLRGTE
jgi:hypothetical protein